MTTNTGVWTGWNNFYGSGSYSINGDTLNISTNAANMSALLYWSTVAKPGEKITIEYDARTVSGVGRITASSRVAYTAYNTQLVGDHEDFRSYSFDVEVPTKASGPQLVFFGVGIWRGDNTTAGAEVEFVLRNVIRHDSGGRQMMRPDTFGMLEPETRLILSSLLTEPNKSHTQLIDDTIYELKQAGIWQKLDCLYLLAAPSSGIAAVNWINPGQYNLKAVNDPTFTANAGYNGRVDADTPPYLQTGFNPVALEGTDDDGNGVADEPWAAQFRTNNNSMFVWATYVEGVSGYIIGTRAHAISPFSATYPTRVYARNGAESGVYVSGISRASGLYGMSRDNDTDFDFYANGVNVGTVSQASGVMYSESIQILKRSANSETCNGNIVRAAGLGAALTDAEYGDLYRILASYMTGIDSPSANLDASYLWAARPDATANDGAEIVVSDVGIAPSRWVAKGGRWLNMHPIVLGVLGAPVTRDAATSTAESAAVFTLPVKGGVMHSCSMIQVLPLATCNNSATNKTLRIKADGASIGSFVLTTVVAEQPLVLFRNINSVSAQKTFTGNASATGSISTAPAATTVNTASDWDLTITLQAANSTNSDTITLESVVAVLF
jgi:hypothetical protein